MTLFRGSGDVGTGEQIDYLRSNNNLSDVNDVAEARQNLGLDSLSSISGLTPADSTFIVGDGVNWVNESGATARSSLGLTIGADVQSHDAGLDDISALTPVDSNFIVGDGTNWTRESGATARTSLGLGTAATSNILDEDDMASNSATNPSSQQSVKAYVDIRSGGVRTVFADEYADLQDAVDDVEASATGGGVVLLSPGTTYTLASPPLTISNQNVSIVCLGGTEISATIEVNTDAVGISLASSVARNKLSGFMLQGPGSGSSTNHGISAAGTTFFLTIDNIRVDGFGLNGVNLVDAIVGRINGCHFSSNGQHGFYCGTGTSMFISHSYARNNTDKGWFLEAMAYVSMNALAADDNGGNAYELKDMASFALHACGSETNGGRALQVNGANNFTICGHYSTNDNSGGSVTVQIADSGTTATTKGHIFGFRIINPASPPTNSWDFNASGTIMLGGVDAPQGYQRRNNIVSAHIHDDGSIPADEVNQTGYMQVVDESGTKRWVKYYT